MKKIVSVILVLTLVLALTGTAMAGCKYKVGQYVKFVKNSNCYEKNKTSSKWDDPETIIHKGSVARVIEVRGSWVAVQLTPAWVDENAGNIAVIGEDGVVRYFWGCWVKDSVLGTTKDDYIHVTFSNGGVGMSMPVVELKDAGETRISADCYKHVKATAKVWMHKSPSLKNNYGRALHKDDVVKYRRVYGADTRGQLFYGIRYKGNCLWVSSAYSKLVK